MKTVAVFGAGVAGLSAAHEFARLGYKVFVFETNPDAGGFFRSSRTATQEIPTEYSWHGMGPWYHNVFDIMKQIPFDETESIYDKGLSRPMLFGLAPDEIKSKFDDSYIFGSKAYRLSFIEKVLLGWLLIKTWTANRRTSEFYSRLNAAEEWRPFLSELGLKTWKATFGPWIGSDWTNVSLHHAGQFFRKNMISGPVHYHKADEEGPAWKHESGNGWLLLRGPSNECWFDRWVEYLKIKGTEFFWEKPLDKLEFDGKNITAAYLASGEKINADIYVLAINPFSAADILKKTPELEKQDPLHLFEPLTQDGPHTQVSFRIAFAKQIRWPTERAALVIVDSEFNLTLFAQEQAWSKDVDLGKDVKSLWTVTACVAKAPGRIYGLPLEKCTKDQFIEEITAQLLNCEGLNFLIKEANNGKGLEHFPILKIEVWHEWMFSPEGIKPKQPKWVNNMNNQPYLPTQTTSLSNLVIAGAHTKTTADLWSIEAAVESGRLAAQVIEPKVKVISQYKPLFLRLISAIDDFCYSIKAPHVLDIFLAILIFIALYLVF
jgi:uncharacterized protein with NAD-binding domain and iron-sulfur cluster